GDTGPYIQYAHARLCSIERRASVGINLEADVSLLTEEHARELINLIARYPEILAGALQSLEPCNIVQYILKLTHATSAALENMRVVGQPDDIAEARLLMYHSVRIIIGNALTLIGLTPIERM
ncbi:arginyl-tRNA synthetase, partial [Kickxella alabastrina]